MARSATRDDLTVGSPRKVLLRYTLPLLGSALFQQMYTLADSVIAGKYAGESALAAIGASNAIVSILTAIALGANAGCAVLTARYKGAAASDKLHTTVSSSMIGFAVLTVLLTVVGVVTCSPILRVLHTPSDILAESETYLNIYLYGMAFVMLYNLATGVFGALGDSRTPFLFLVASSLTNIFLDWLFAAVFRWGVAGVAWATFLTQGVACVATMIVLLVRMRKLRGGARYALWSWRLFGGVLLAALPVMLQNSFVSVGNLFVQIVVNGYGSSVLAGFTAGFRIIIVGTTCLITFGTGLTNYVAQNFGAQKFARIRRGYLEELWISSVVAVAFGAVAMLCATPFVSLFLEDAEQSVEALGAGVKFLLWVAPFYPVVNAKIASDCTVRGLGGNVGFAISTLSDLVLRVAFAFLLSPSLGFLGVCLAWPIGWVLGMGVALLFLLCNRHWRRGMAEARAGRLAARGAAPAETPPAPDAEIAPIEPPAETPPARG